jgi:hypothetical protein
MTDSTDPARVHAGVASYKHRGSVSFEKVIRHAGPPSVKAELDRLAHGILIDKLTDKPAQDRNGERAWLDIAGEDGLAPDWVNQPP